MRIVQYFKPPVLSIHQFCMDTVKANLPDNATYELITGDIDAPPEYKIVRDATDWLRLYELNKDPETFWIDSDMIALRKLDFPIEKGKPYLFKNTCIQSAFYGNGCKEIIAELFGIEHVGKITENLKALGDRIEFIPDGYLLHLHLGCMLEGVNPTLLIKKNQHCSVYRNEPNGEWKFKSIEGYKL